MSTSTIPARAEREDAAPAIRDADPEAQAEQLRQQVATALEHAKRAGATAAEASASDATGLAVTVRQRELETVEFNNDRGVAVTVYVGHRKGHATTSDTSAGAIRDTVRAAVNIAKYTQEDPCNGLAPAERMATTFPALDMHHPWPIDVAEATRLATAAEVAALDSDPRIVNSEGAEIETRRSCHAYGNSHGFVGEAWGTRHGISCSVIAADEAGMQSDFEYTEGRAAEDLEAAETVGREAARRALARLGRGRVKTGTFPVLFSPPMATGLIRHLLAAIRGTALYRKESYLCDSLGKQALAKGITLAEHPHRPRGLGSAAFDSDGVATRAKAFVADGIVESYILGVYAARRLGLETTGNAGGVRNLDVEAERLPEPALLRQMGTGLVVTSLMGQGVNLVTGDYSRGAGGFWVEGGEIAYPVDEVTIAANLDAMFKGIAGCGDDVDRRGNIHTGSLLVGEMTVAG